MHVVLVDNGRSDIIANEQHWLTLKCIRCGACMNTCPVYRRSTGYSYTYFIPGPIGVNLGMLKNANKYYDNVSACSLCLSCSNVCPAKVDLGEQVYRWRQQLKELGHASSEKKWMSRGMSLVFNNKWIYNSALWWSPMLNHMPRFLIYNGLNGWGKGHEMMRFPKKPFHVLWKNGKVK